MRSLVVLEELIVIQVCHLILHGLLPLILLLVELYLDGVDVPLRRVALLCEFFDRRLDGFELDSIVSDALFERFALNLVLVFQEGCLLVNGLSLLGSILVSCSIKESLLVIKIRLNNALCIWYECLSFCNLSLLLFGQLDLVHWPGVSWCDTKAKLSLVLDFADTIVISCISSLQSILV